ncbi:hypothetical protein A3A60_03105 [Candidatus Curtissbacteria bacterium RIFCSPLOWO2_01_FULL_42_26]|uniref:RNase H type-1 domain-containing protein n=1 Tax=Candidatus Curtissbacteria bacterium RIFCSPLOWO2_01_FULL_42_26 TaxID=1797729 RepID=A0A1F5I2L9_9BACT|nr:MAG: hypothetical protein A3A60_03105 [Candidatus Curtissbacteria bacterium RIFCSPLOWO2_01_FULL_42_26]
MLTVFCDGGSRGNPGKSAFGFVVLNNGQIIKEGAGAIGHATNNFAEYTALIKALEWLGKNRNGEELEINMDSKLVVSQVSGLFKVKNATIRGLLFKIRELEGSFVRINYKYIPREQNTDADKLVNKVLDELEFRI